jgi:hypothetical protein
LDLIKKNQKNFLTIMVIEIDDSGTGDLVGNAFIGLLRKETGELSFRTLPVELFQGANWMNKMPIKFTLTLVKDGLKEMNFNKEKELILIMYETIL